MWAQATGSQSLFFSDHSTIFLYLSQFICLPRKKTSQLHFLRIKEFYSLLWYKCFYIWERCSNENIELTKISGHCKAGSVRYVFASAVCGTCFWPSCILAAQGFSFSGKPEMSGAHPECAMLSGALLPASSILGGQGSNPLSDGLCLQETAQVGILSLAPGDSRLPGEKAGSPWAQFCTLLVTHTEIVLRGVPGCFSLIMTLSVDNHPLTAFPLLFHLWDRFTEFPRLSQNPNSWIHYCFSRSFPSPASTLTWRYLMGKLTFGSVSSVLRLSLEMVMRC